MKMYILRTLYLVLYLMIASQGMFYLLGISKALRQISISAFIEQRKSIDTAIGDPLRFLYFTSVGIAVIIVISNVKNPRSIVFITVLLSLICILVDVSLAVRRSIPLNEIFNNYPQNRCYDIETARTEWLSIINVRGAIAIAGLLILLSGVLTESLRHTKAGQRRVDYSDMPGADG